jgi:hypothetical protein
MKKVKINLWLIHALTGGSYCAINAVEWPVSYPVFIMRYPMILMVIWQILLSAKVQKFTVGC